MPQSALSLSSNATGSPDQVVAHTDYIWNDNITTTLTSATGTYLIDFPANQYTRDLANTTHYSCAQTSYDTAAYATGQQSSLSKGEATTSDAYTGCGTSPSFTPGGQLRSTTAYDVYGQVVAGKDPDANAGVSGHVGCTVTSVQYTMCATYDSVYKTLLVSSANALNQSASTAYTTTLVGALASGRPRPTDSNGQTMSVTYDALGRGTSSTLPGEGVGLTTTGTTYTVWCSPTGAQAPCVEIDETQRLDGSNTVTQRSFYDALGRLVETRPRRQVARMSCAIRSTTVLTILISAATLTSSPPTQARRGSSLRNTGCRSSRLFLDLRCAGSRKATHRSTLTCHHHELCGRLQCREW